MSLREYKRKRKFEETPEPTGGKSKERMLRFVVQKHNASRLHYDFRLELDGVLKSWAVPRGPSLNPRDKRLAMMVEDHPYDYRTFEGVIPEGNYGAGEVIVWDEGFYSAPGITDRKEAEKALRAGLEKGDLKFTLYGHKLKGEFALVKIKYSRDGKDNSWLLIKHKDQYASEEDVAQMEQSVISGRTVEELAGGKKERVWESHKKKENRGKKTEVSGKNIDLGDAPKAAPPREVKPMLATLVDEPFTRKDWIFEIKWDGFRAIAECRKTAVRLYSRNNLDFNERFPEIAAELKKMDMEAVLDGEVVAVDESGKSQFQYLQNYHREPKGKLLYCVFDILYLNGRDLKNMPLIRRKEILKSALKNSEVVKYSDHVAEDGQKFFEAARKQGLEGIIAKDSKSPYRPGVRGREWLKIKILNRQEAVIGGFTAPRGSRKELGALVLGVYDGSEFKYIGHTGGGLEAYGLARLRKQLEPLVQKESPFGQRPKTNMPATWVHPRLVCEVKFQEWTSDGSMRQPIFLGLRPDKPAKDVRREKPADTDTAVNQKKKKKIIPEKTPPKSGGVMIDGRVVELTHLDKVFWPKEKYLKGDAVEYYRRIAPVILPYLKDRPESLHRHPDGITGESFFQKNVDHQPPNWVKVADIYSESNEANIRYALIQDEASLLYFTNWGCIEFNPWLSRMKKLEKPDFVLFDFDPEDIGFDKVIEAAQMVHKVLDSLGAPNYVKTSGATGLHIAVPLGAKYDYEQSKTFAEIVMRMVQRKLPKTTSVERMPKKRQKKVYLDYLQNRKGQTMAAPYCIRPKSGAPVSTPLKWSEVKKGLDPGVFNIKTIFKRLDKVGDLWKPVLGPGIDLKKILKKLSRD